MKWLSISSDSRQKVYELRQNKETLLTLTYHPASRTIRISADDEKRVFLLGKEGFIHSRTVLQNEYGIRMGQLSHDGNQEGHGNIEFSQEQFNFIVQDDSPAKAAIYKNGDILLVCELPEILESHKKRDHDLLMLTLCWYISAAVKEEEYA
jgi:hypothetical protein